MDYIREQSVGEILQASIRIYFKNFGSVFLVSLLMFPVFCLSGFPETAIIGILLNVIVNSFVVATLTVVISEVCLGHKPSPARAYKRVFGAMVLKVFVTGLLFGLAVYGGLLLLIIPGVFISLWFILCQVVVVLEGKWGRAALKRSKQLGKGFYLRILVVLIIMFGLMILPGFVIGFCLAFMAGTPLFVVLTAFLQTLVMPFSLIPLVLMYYDLRVRKESYDTAALAEDLKH
ncbi:MAG: hypothetical protein GY774_30295 [Planctomycetes bacterium]|nr:hypothetical protein [Planctomycetota bacterium]